MVKFWKKIGRLVGLVLVLVSLLLLGLVLFLPMDKVSDKVVAQLEAATGARVVIGDASLQLFPALGVRLGQGHIQGTGSDLASATGTENNLGDYDIQLENLSVTVSVLPLLQKNIVIDAIKVAGPLIRVQQDKNEVVLNNYSLAITDLMLPMAEVTEAGQTKNVPPGELIPAGLAFDFDFYASGITSQKNPFEDVSASGTLAHRIMKIESLQAIRAEGVVQGDMIVDWQKDAWGQLRFNFTMTDVSSGALFQPLMSGMQDRLSGNLSGFVAGSCSLKDSETILETMDLAGELHGKDGVLYVRDLLQGINQYLGRQQDLLDISFKSLDHIFKIENGRYVVDNLKIDGLETEWTCDGWFGLQGTVNLNILVRLPAGFTPDFGEYTILAEVLRDSEGRIPLAFKLKGATSRPKVVMDLSAFDQIQQQVEAGAKEVIEDAAKKGLSEILDKWKIR